MSSFGPDCSALSFTPLHSPPRPSMRSMAKALSPSCSVAVRRLVAGLLSLMEEALRGVVVGVEGEGGLGECERFLWPFFLELVFFFFSLPLSPSEVLLPVLLLLVNALMSSLLMTMEGLVDVVDVVGVVGVVGVGIFCPSPEESSPASSLSFCS